MPGPTLELAHYYFFVPVISESPAFCTPATSDYSHESVTMATFLTANLPSDDEEDNSYDPLADRSGEPADRPDRPKRNAGHQAPSRYATQSYT